MTLDYRVVPLPAVWPGAGGKQRPSWDRKRAPFKANWTKTLDLLAREIRMLGGTRVEIAVDVDERHLRQDGQLRADARPRSSAVVVSFSKGKDRLVFPADRFAFWQDNVDAVARALEALRMVDRYGVQQGKQYEGYKALPSGGASTAALSTAAAAEVLDRRSGYGDDVILKDREIAKRAVRLALHRAHPDTGGTAADFALVQEVKRVLEAHHGGSL